MSPLHTLAHLSTSSLRDVTAFSALPDAPVRPVRQSRFAPLVAAWRGRRDRSAQSPSLRRPSTVVPARSSALDQPAACRMVA